MKRKLSADLTKPPENMRHALSGRDALNLLPRQIAWGVFGVLACVLMIDLYGLPTSIGAKSFFLGLLTSLLWLFVSHLRTADARRFPYHVALNLLSVLSGVIPLFGLGVAFGDAAFAEQGSWPGMVTGVVAGFGVSAGRLKVSVASIAGRAVRKPPSLRTMKANNHLGAEDLEVAAYHEIGHALALGLVPEDWRQGAFVQVAVGKSPYVYMPALLEDYPLPAGTRISAPFVRWEMLAYLAGGAFADMHFGRALSGTGIDLVEWRTRAARHFEIDKNLDWTQDPSSKEALMLNNDLLHDLALEQFHVLAKFYEANKALYEEMVQHVLREGVIEEDDLNRYLARAVTPDIMAEYVTPPSSWRPSKSF